MKAIEAAQAGEGHSLLWLRPGVCGLRAQHAFENASGGWLRVKPSG